MRTAVMKTISIISCIALLALNALSLFTAPNDIHSYFTGASLAIALGLLVAIVLVRSEGAGPKSRTETAQPMPVPVASNQAEAEIISFPATLQERGRLIDFLMDDITTYDDAQVDAVGPDAAQLPVEVSLPGRGR